MILFFLILADLYIKDIVLKLVCVSEKKIYDNVLVYWMKDVTGVYIYF